MSDRGLNTGHFEQSVIASGQARLPVPVDANAFVPAQYEQAIQALIFCQTIDEARAFDSAADALAAWAKIYCDDRAAHAARVLKLHAYRRVGVLAQQLRPTQGIHRGAKGPNSLLVESGFKHHEAIAAVKVSRMPQNDFDRIAAQRRPPSPAMLAQVSLQKNPAWARIRGRFSGVISVLRKGGLADLVAGLDDSDLQAAERSCDEVTRLIERFRQHIKQRQHRNVA
jgi:hypothetical protein